MVYTLVLFPVESVAKRFENISIPIPSAVLYESLYSSRDSRVQHISQIGVQSEISNGSYYVHSYTHIQSDYNIAMNMNSLYALRLIKRDI